MHRQIALLCLLLSLPLSAFAQQSNPSNWASYLADYDGMPGSVLLDMGLFPNGPDTTLPILMKLTLKTDKATINGLPDSDEVDRMTEVLSVIISATEKNMRIVTAGLFAHDASRSVYTYVKDSTSVKMLVVATAKKLYPKIDVEIVFRADKPWDAYYKFLYPSEAILTTMKR